METDLHVVELGEGDPIVFVHGSFGWGEDTFPDQRELGDDYRVVLVDRRGYGDSPPAKRFDFDSLTEDICALLGDGVHLVGHSYGGLLCLLAAARRPEAVWSLAAIEPPAASIARGHPVVESIIERAAWLAQADPTAPALPGLYGRCGL
ncbi:MAG TPA: alpha/beta fold hydrolase [Jiangellaceae bacterium]|nr:alpha/beta fold hydrolase [Jiangellaceae bacterium]